MDSNTVRNVAIWEVTYGLGPSNTTNLSAPLKEKYETERSYQETLKQEASKK